MTFEFDYARLEEKLREATFAAYSRILQLTSQEHLYVFGLYTLDDTSYLFPTANTQEGLTRRAGKYSEEYGHSVELNRVLLKWSPCDWHYHLSGEKLFEEVQALLRSGWSQERGEYTQDPEKMEKICIKALADLRREMNTPDRVLFNLFKGDQSDEEMIRFARKLNSRDAVTRFQFELKQGNEAFMRLSDCGR